jgi:hypothetical protein
MLRGKSQFFLAQSVLLAIRFDIPLAASGGFFLPAFSAQCLHPPWISIRTRFLCHYFFYRFELHAFEAFNPHQNLLFSVD